MSSATLLPNGNGTFSGTWTGTGGSPAYTYLNVDEGTDSPNDSDYAAASSANASGIYLLSDTPSDWNIGTACTAKIRCSNSIKGGLKWNTVQIFKADESTALTGTGDISTGTTSATTISVSLSITGATDKTSWDGARVKLTTGASGTGSAAVYAIQIEMTYTATATGRIHRAASLDGLGGAGQRRFNPVLLRSLWTPRPKKIFLPAFEIAG